jgi:carotenoid cleavage dioxygenase-like enzyme
MEFPRVNEHLTGRRHRFGYATPVERGGDTIIGTTTLKFDLEEGRVEHYDHGPGRHPGELVFVPRSGGTAEDDGYLIGFVHDDATTTADLVILSAQDLKDAPIAIVHLPVRVPFGFHGNWIPS